MTGHGQQLHGTRGECLLSLQSRFIWVANRHFVGLDCFLTRLTVTCPVDITLNYISKPALPGGPRQSSGLWAQHAQLNGWLAQLPSSLRRPGSSVFLLTH